MLKQNTYVQSCNQWLKLIENRLQQNYLCMTGTPYYTFHYIASKHLVCCLNYLQYLSYSAMYISWFAVKPYGFLNM